MTNNDENTAIVFDIATEEDYLRYINRPHVSAMQAAFLVSGYVPYKDFTLPANSSRLQREIYEIYLFLHECAVEKKVYKAREINGEFFARLDYWTGYLFNTGQPVVDALMDAFVFQEKLDSCAENSVESSTQKNCTHPILEAQIELLSLIFPDISYKGYWKFPIIKAMVKELNISLGRFLDIASEASKTPRVAGRKKKNKFESYKQSLPHLKPWFKEIEDDKETET